MSRIPAVLCEVNSITSAYYFHRLWEIVALEPEVEGEVLFDGEIEVDESHFGVNSKGRRGQGGSCFNSP